MTIVTIFMNLSGMWQSHGSYAVYVAVTGVYFPFFFCENCLAWLIRDRLMWRCVCGIELKKRVIYRVSQKKRNGGFSVPCELKVLYLFTSLNQTSSAEENDTKIIKFDWVILILWPFVKTQSFSNFAWFLRPMSEELCREWPFMWCFGEAHWSVSTKETWFNGIPQNIEWKAIPDIILHSAVANIERNLKMTVFHEMGIESKLSNQI